MTVYPTAMKVILTIALCGVTACAQQPRGNDVQQSRFNEIDAIVVAPDAGLAPVLTGGHPVVPRIPTGRLGSKARVTATVAYVVDTTGAIERQTVSFMSGVPADYRSAVCEWSRGARFEPLVVNGVRKRGLTVSSFSFFRAENPFNLEPPPSLALEMLKTLREMPVSELLPMLEKKIHC